MSVADVAVVGVDVAVAAGLGWWFFGPKPTAEATIAGGVQEVRVMVRGGYSPSRIRARAGLPVRLVFDRRESGDCTSRVVFPDLGVSADLPAFAQTSLELAAAPPGEYGFACGMNMIHGVLVLDPADTAAGPDGPGATAVDATAGPGVQRATVVVDGGYRPSRITARPGVPLRLAFDRRDGGLLRACHDPGSGGERIPALARGDGCRPAGARARQL